MPPANGQPGISLLLLEDNLGDARLTQHALKAMVSPAPEVTWARSLEEAQAQLRDHQFMVVLTDLDVPDSEGLNTCRSLVAAAGRTPVVVLTGSHDESLGLVAVQAGAQDFLVKGDYHGPELRRVLRHAMERQHLQVALMDAKQQVETALGRLRELEAMRQQLALMLVHDLRSPVFCVQLHLEHMLRGAARPGQADFKEDLRELQTLSNQLIEMVSSILDVHRIEANEMPISLSPWPLRELVAEVISFIAGHAPRVPVQTQFEDLTITCDKALMRRVIGNLLSNALRFSPEGHAVVIAARRLEHSVEVTVQNDGIPIPMEARARIFEKFGSLDAATKGYSTGLGLPFCKIAVQAHHGTIGVRSDETSGTTFWFTIPD
jgi:two-component system sensor histidine kinase/response regulator